MKHTLIILIITLSIQQALQATPELDDYSIEGKHISFSITYRYNSDIERLYYKSLLDNLDSFADKLKQTGKLNRGKIYFDIMTAIWMDHAAGIEMYRYKHGYYCWINALHQNITQDYMTKIITYFASDNWNSFCYDYTKTDPAKAIQIFNRIIDNIPVSHRYVSKKVLDVNGNIAVWFENSELICKDANKIYGKINHLLPFSAGSKYFITIEETIYIIENGNIINQIKLPIESFDYECWEEVFPKWVNFRCSSYRYFLSYSIEMNKFYKLDYIH